MPTMNGSAAPASNLNFGLAVSVIYLAVMATIDANHWFVVPASLYGASGAIQYAASHLWDWRTGDNKP